MSFSENLQTLRKANNISQEQLAERLDVSRQAVSKWETDGGYPEMDKIIALCSIFGCTMDELVTGKISVDMPNERKEYDSHYNRFAKGMALGVGLIIFGVAMVVLLSAISMTELMDAIGVTVLFMCIGVAVAIFIVLGLEDENFKRLHRNMPEIYTEEERSRFLTGTFPKAIAAGVALIFLGLVLVVLVGSIAIRRPHMLDIETLSVAAFLTCIAVATTLFVYAGIQHDKYDIKKYNHEIEKHEGIKNTDFPETVRMKRHRTLVGKICGIIMLTATAIFLGIGFVFNIWSPTWAVFPIGGILCGIVGIAFGEHD